MLFHIPVHTINKVAHEGDLFLSLPLVILAIFSIFFGFITKDIFIGLGSSFFIDNSLFIHPVHEIMIDTEFAVPTLFKLLPLIFTICFSLLAICFSEFLPEFVVNFKLSRLGYNIFGFFNQRSLIEMFYNKYITDLVLKLGEQSTKILDNGSIELMGPEGGQKVLNKLSKKIDNLSGDTNIPKYALFLLSGLVFVISLFLVIQDYSDISASSLGALIFFISFSSLLTNEDSPNKTKATMEAKG